jgi:hypothetical protein
VQQILRLDDMNWDINLATRAFVLVWDFCDGERGFGEEETCFLGTSEIICGIERL